MLFERIQLESGETILAIVRKHWWIIFVETFIISLGAVLPLVIFALITSNAFDLPNLVTSSITDHIDMYSWELYFLYLAWLLVLWMALANLWTDYYLDLWLITNRRVLLVDQRGYFRRFISSFRLERLQDMNIEVNGIIATLLDYGTIEAQTAGGSNEKFIGYYLPKPRDIKAMIIAAAEDVTFNHQTPKPNSIQSDL